MADARSITKALYVSDILGPGTSFIRRVDAHFAGQAQLGWVAATGGELPMVSSIRPRHAVGVDASGRGHAVVVATTGADLWLRNTLTWNILDDAGGTTAVKNIPGKRVAE